MDDAWALGIGHGKIISILITNYPLPITHYQLPIPHLVFLFLIKFAT